jgi:hypothetical protein
MGFGQVVQSPFAPYASPYTSSSLPSLGPIAGQQPSQGAQQAWQQVAQQMANEGQDANAINVAQQDFANAYSTLAQGQVIPGYVGSQGAQQIISATQQYVMLGHTVLGAYQTIVGLAQAAEQAGATPAAVAQAFGGIAMTITGVLVGVGVTAAAGVGAAIVAGLELLSTILGSSPPPGSSVCGTTVSPPVSYTVNCAYTYGQPVPGGPGSAGWNRFPDPSITADAMWFQPPVPSFTWNGANWGAVPGQSGVRMIDLAFPVYRQLECEMQGDVAAVIANPNSVSPATLAFAQFRQAFFTAWKSSMEYALNGTNPVPDWATLVQTANFWNMAHAPGDGWMIQGVGHPGTITVPLQPGSSCRTNMTPYVNMLINGVPGWSGGGPRPAGRSTSVTGNTSTSVAGLQLNTGPLLGPAGAPTSLTPTSASSSGVGGAAAIGTGALIAAGALAAGQGWIGGQIIDKAWEGLKSMAGKAFSL